MTVTCTHGTCTRPRKAKGLCSMHYDRQRLGIPMDAPPGKVTTEGVCEGPECSRKILAKRLCTAHYAQQRSGAPLTPLRKYLPKGVPCAAGSCRLDAEIEGMCRPHRQRFLAGDPRWERPARRHAAKGSGHLGKDGYRYVQYGGRQIGEHRARVAELLGRPLTRAETVHHLNGNRSDNTTDGPLAMSDNGKLRSGNLELWSTSQPAGQEIGPKVDWALDLLALYGEYLTESQRGRLIAS